MLELRIDDLWFHYAGRRVFDGWSASCPAGVTWLRGANGSGKSTLLRLLAGSLRPEAGTLSLAGCEAGADPSGWRRQLLWCDAEPWPVPWLTLSECLGLVAGLYPGDHEAAVREQLQHLALLPLLDQRMGALSLGQQRKAQLVLALALPVRLLLLDEPFNALDAAAAAYLRTRLDWIAVQARQVVLLTSHIAPGLPLAQELTLAPG